MEELVATSGLVPSCLGTEGLHVPGHPDLALGSTAPASIPGRPQAGLKLEFRNAESEAVRYLFPGKQPPRGPSSMPEPTLKSGEPEPPPAVRPRHAASFSASLLLGSASPFCFPRPRSHHVPFWRLGCPACSPHVHEYDLVHAALRVPVTLHQGKEKGT